MADVTLSVSVVIPAHNSKSTIERALRSVFAQTELPHEVIVVDDCSTDDTSSLVRTIATTAPCPVNLIVLDQNVGPSQTRNTGWNAATQEYIAFLDSDDTWHPQKLEIQFGWMRNHLEHSITGHLTGTSERFLDNKDVKAQIFRLRHFLIRNRISTPTVMIRREITERFNAAQWYAEDYELWLRILCRNYQIVRLEVPLTQLHKADFGESGLSSRLFAMYRGELLAMSNLRSTGKIAKPTWVILLVWLSTKYLLRVVRTQVRRLR